MCSQQLSVVHWMNNLMIHLLCIVLQCLCFSKIAHLLIRFTKTNLSWNTKNTDINGRSNQNTHMHTKHFEKDNIGKVSMKISDSPLFLNNPFVLPTPLFLWKNSESLFLGKFQKTQPAPLYKGERISTMVL